MNLDELKGLIEKIKTTATSTTDEVHEMIALSLAEATSIKAGQYLSNEEMNDLIDRLFACNHPNFTPTGKAIMVILSQEEIAAKFN